MLRRVKMKNFRQHRDLEINFGPGTTVIRGANEAGKSTTLLAFAYALFGVSALPDSLEETVTWGEDINTLKVEADIEIEGTCYTFVRGKSGAECRYDVAGETKRVTGQKEVTKFAAELMGGDVKTASRLMLAKQNAIRGALEEGAAALSQQIEYLADFELFDEIIEKIQKYRVTGPTKALAERIESLRGKLDLLKPDDFDPAPLEAEIGRYDRDLAALATRIADVLEKSQREADIALHTAKQTSRQLHDLQEQRAQAFERVQRRAISIAQTEQVANLQVDESQLEILAKQLAEATDHDRRVKHHADMVKLMQAYPDDIWEGTREEFLEFLNEQSALSGKLATEIATKNGEIKALKAQLVTSSVCGFCKQDMSQFPEVAKRNKALMAQMDTLQAEVQKLSGERDEANTNVQAATTLQRSAKPFEAFQYIPDWVAKDGNFVPPKFEWKGEVPPKDGINLTGIRAAISDLRDQITNRDAAKVRLLELRRMLAEEDQPALEAVEAKLATIKPVDHPAIEAAYREASEALEAARQKHRIMQNKLADQRQLLARAKAEHEADVQAFERTRAELQEAEANLAKQEKANALLKKVRQARPVIADQLWNTVLAAVSVMVTQLRQQESIITKDGDGFKINGRGIQNLSGSALDLLGLALRVAQLKTFLPHVPMLLLDEATAACDEDRTTAMLGFLASIDFKQKILVTHEPVSEQFADHLVEI